MSKQDQVSVQQISQQIDDDLLTSAREADVDVESVITAQIEKHDGYGADVLSRFASSAVERKVESAKADTLTGILMGCRDRYTKNWPRRHSLIRSDGDHIELSTWSGSLPGPDGAEMDLPPGGAMVELKAEFDQQYESWEGKQIVSSRGLSHEDLATGLSKVAQDPSEITPRDEYEVRVVRGEIMWINPQTVFPADEDKDLYDGEVMMSDDRGQLQPHFEMVLDAEQGTRFRAHVERQKNGRPYFILPDFEMLTMDAYEEFETPDAQTQFLEDGLKGVEVFIVGSVSGYETDRDGEGEPVNYVDMNVASIVAADPEEVSDGQSSVENFGEEDADEGGDEDVAEEEGEGSEETEPEPEADDSDDESEESEPEFECEGCGKTFEEKNQLNGHKSSCDEYPPEEDVSDDPVGDVGNVAENIADYEDLTGEELETVAEVRDKLQSVGDEIDDVVISAALSDGEASGDTGPEEGSLEAVLEPYLEGGTYSCPDDECLASAGSVGELGAHAADDHDLDDDQTPEDWLRQQA